MSEYERLIERLESRLPPPAPQETVISAALQAAVALILGEIGGRAQMLVIKRAEDPRDHWSGHLALPGGRRDPDDVDLIDTAVREVCEEVGIVLSRERSMIGCLNPLAPNNPRLPPIVITPFVALAPEDLMLNLSAEVDAAFWISPFDLRSAGRSASVTYEFDGRKYKWPAYATERGPIWGITERILTDFLQHLD